MLGSSKQSNASFIVLIVISFDSYAIIFNVRVAFICDAT